MCIEEILNENLSRFQNFNIIKEKNIFFANNNIEVLKSIFFLK